MPRTQVRSQQIEDGGVTRADINTATVGGAVITKIIQGAGMSNSSSGADAGTGDVTISVVYGTAAGTATQGNDTRLLTGIEDSPRQFMSNLAPGNAAFLLVSGVGYFVYLGRAAVDMVVKFVEFHVSTAGAGAQVAEVGLFSSPTAPNKTALTMTKLVATGTVDALTSIGVKRNTSAFATNILAGTHLWAGIRTAMATTQPTIWGIGVDMAQGKILTKAAVGVLTGAGPFTTAIVAAATATSCLDLRATLD